jgi:fibrillarin-like rRNA methylase
LAHNQFHLDLSSQHKLQIFRIDLKSFVEWVPSSLLVAKASAADETLELHQVLGQEVEELQEDDGALGDHEVGQRRADLKPIQ